MKAIKRIQLTLMHYKVIPPGPPVKEKAYCRYPGCGRVFKPVDALQEFCSRTCLQDYNYKPPAPWYPPPRAGLNIQGWWPEKLRRRNESGSFKPSQRPIPAMLPAANLSGPRCFEDLPVRRGHRHTNTHHGAFPHPSTPPAASRGASHQTMTPQIASRGITGTGQPTRPAPAPTLRARTRAHDLPRPPSSKFRNMPLPPIRSDHPLPPLPPHARHHSTAGLWNDRPAQSPMRNFNAGPSVVPPARPRHHATARRGPRPRSNSFGGFRFPAQPHQH